MGSGRIGLGLAKLLVGQGYEVKSSTRTVENFDKIESVGAKPFIVDIERSAESLKDFLKSRILVICLTNKNIQGFDELLNQIEVSPVEKVIFVSSTSVYDNLNRVVSEGEGLEDEAKPLSIIENIFKSSDQIEATIVRFSGLIGNDRNPGNFFRHGRPIKYPNAPVNLIHHDDCLNILNLIIEKNIWGEDFNCCADTHPTKKEFYTQATKRAGHAAPEFVSSDDDPFKIISNQKVKDVLAYDLIHSDLMKIEFE